MKEMDYSPMRRAPELLAAGTYKGLAYYVVSNGTHPCAYVNVAGTRLEGVAYFSIEGLDCHGGLTYSAERINAVSEKGWYLGWDYAHFGDCFGGSAQGKRYSTGEIVAECKNIIGVIVADQKAFETSGILKACLIAIIALLLIMFFANRISVAVEPTEYAQYTVSAGDTIWDIANGHCDNSMDIREFIYRIEEINDTKGGLIHEGDVLSIPLE